MRRKLPSLIGLKNFEATARHLSFTKAADELCVSQAAVSHQIKGLEEDLGVKLFYRYPQRVELSDRGRKLLEVTRECFDHMETAVNSIRAGDSLERICLRVTPFFSGLWLVPRLADFYGTHPEYDLTLHHSLSQPVAGYSKDDFIIYFGDGKWEGFEAEYLFSGDLIPLCSPKLLKGSIPLDDPAGLATCPLIHEFNYDWWAMWFEKAGIKIMDVDLDRGPVVDDPNVLTNLALEGRGVILGSSLFLDHYIESGELVSPVEEQFSIDIDYYLLYRPKSLDQPKLNCFRDWLVDAASGMGQYIKDT